MQEKKPAAATELCVECEAWKWYYNLTILRSRNPKVAQHLGMGKAGKWGRKSRKMGRNFLLAV